MSHKTIELWDVSEIQRQLKVSRARAYQLIDNPRFPKPQRRLRLGHYWTLNLHTETRLWRADEIRAWREARQPAAAQPQVQGSEPSAA